MLAKGRLENLTRITVISGQRDYSCQILPRSKQCQNRWDFQFSPDTCVILEDKERDKAGLNRFVEIWS